MSSILATRLGAALLALLLGAIPALVTAQETASRSDKTLLGWVENIRLLPSDTPMKAKLDSGAKSNSLHAIDIERFEADGRDMVRFTVLRDHDDPNSARMEYERPVVREVGIKLRNTSRRDERVVVRLEFCLAGERYNALFNLTNRGGFNYPVLLGRDFLKQHFLIDPSRSFTHKARCLPQD